MQNENKLGVMPIKKLIWNMSLPIIISMLVQPPMEPDSVRRLCDAVSRTCSGRCAVFAGTDGGYKYAVIHAGQDISPLVKEMNAALHGRGGGRNGFAQGSAACTEEEIRRFWAESA